MKRIHKVKTAVIVKGTIPDEKVHLMNYIESKTDNNSALFVSLNKPHNRLTESGVELRLREMGKKLGGRKGTPT